MLHLHHRGVRCGYDVGRHRGGGSIRGRALARDDGGQRDREQREHEMEGR